MDINSTEMLREEIDKLSKSVYFFEVADLIYPNLIEGEAAAAQVIEGLQKIESLLERSKIEPRPNASSTSEPERHLNIRRTLGESSTKNLCNLSTLRFGEKISEHEIHRGSLDLYRSTTMVTPSTTPNIYFAILDLSKVHKGHVLLSENHDSHGYHFHYADANRRRSDVIFTLKDDCSTDNETVVTWQKHAVHKSAFPAHVRAWGTKKRRSASDVCIGDKRRNSRKIADYVRPGKEHELLIIK